VFVYVITCHVNGKRYVGKSNMPATRWTSHKAEARSGCERPLYRAMRKYGTGAFEFEIVETCESEAASFEAEKLWILRLRSNERELGYNLTSGGEGASGFKPAPELVKRRAASVRSNGKKLAVLRQVIELHEKGLTDPEIAERVGRSAARVLQLRQEAGISGPGRGVLNAAQLIRRGEAVRRARALSEENRSNILRLRESGLSIRAIARATGYSQARVSQTIERGVSAESAERCSG